MDSLQLLYFFLLWAQARLISLLLPYYLLTYLVTYTLCIDLTVDIESFWMADYAGQIPNRGFWLAILLLWL